LRASPSNARKLGPAQVFAALGDVTRLSLVQKLSSGAPLSISQLTAGSRLTRQAVTKHLGVLESVGVVHGVRAGREKRFAFDPGPVDQMKKYLEFVSLRWEEGLGRLKKFVES
jgi:DNA-binding transcriptional ArsR family regulator